MSFGPWLIGSACLALAADNSEQPKWLTDYRQALAVARESGKPLFVVFRCEH